MNGQRASATPNNESSLSDAALAAAKTECVELSDEDEKTVTAAIEALQHLLKRMSEGERTCNGTDWPMDNPVDCTGANDYLSHFSYGLTPGEARYIVYCYLQSTSMNIPKALENLARSVQFRTQQNLHKMALFPCLISISGFDQSTMCEELGIPFIHNLTSGKRYVDAEGRLRLEQDQMDYFNVQCDDIYANITTNANNQIATPVSVSQSPKDCASSVAQNSNRRSSGSRKNINQPNNDSLGSRRGSLASLCSDEGDPRKKGGTGTRGNDNNITNGTTGGWRSFISFHLFGHPKDKEANTSLGLHSPTSSFGARSSDGYRIGAFHSVLSASDGSRNASFGGHDRVNDDESVVSQDAVLLDPAAAGEALTGSPYTLYNDSLNFQGILEPIVSVITKHVPFSFHYWDREGHPIMYCRLGGLNSKRLMRELFALTPINAEPRALVMLFSTYALAVLWQLVRYSNRKNQRSDEIHDALLTQVHRTDCGGVARRQTTDLFRKKAPVGSCVAVIDCAGLKLHRHLYKPLLIMIKSIVSLNLRHYPELLHHAYITNCNAAMSFSYLMLRSMLSEETRQKVTFCSRARTASTLLEQISSDLLPNELGGKCRCPGGCIPSTPAVMFGADFTSLSRGRAETLSMSLRSESSTMEQMGARLDEGELTMHRLHCTVERLNLGPHRSTTLSFAMAAHTEIIWEFLAKNKQRVTFSAIFVSAADDGKILSVVPRQRVENDAGHYICPSFGTVIFRWSNKRSYFRRCRVNLKVYREEQTVVAMQT